MTGNRDILDALLESGVINLQPSTSLDRLPQPFPTDFDFSKIEGMMLGLAIGDALGNTEGKLPEHRQATHGEIRDYLFQSLRRQSSRYCTIRRHGKRRGVAAGWGDSGWGMMWL